MFNTKRHYYSFMMWGATLLFVILYLLLSYHNRLAADDLYYLANYPKIGIWGCMENLYLTYSGRWSAYLLTGAVVSLSHLKWTLLVFHATTIACLSTILSMILHQILNLRLKHNLGKAELILYATIIVMELFFTSYSIGETWFWLVQVCTYLWSIIMSLTLIYIFLKKSLKKIDHAAIIISGLFIGGSSESYALINLFLLTGYLICANSHFQTLPLIVPSKRLNYKIVLAISALLIGFGITMSAPGNEIRYEALPHPSFPMLGWIQLKSFIKIIAIRTPLNLPLLVLFGIPWLILGHQHQNKKTSYRFTKSTISDIIVFLALIFVFLIPTSLIMAEIGPDRALSFISFFITIGFSGAMYRAGLLLQLPHKSIPYLKAFTSSFIIIFLAFHITIQYQTTSRYANSYDQRTVQLQTMKQKKGNSPIILTPLPPSGMLFSAEITSNPNHFINQFLKKACKINSEIIIK